MYLNGITELDAVLIFLLISYFFKSFKSVKILSNLISLFSLSIKVTKTLSKDSTLISVFLSKNSTVSPTFKEDESISDKTVT